MYFIKLAANKLAISNILDIEWSEKKKAANI